MHKAMHKAMHKVMHKATSNTRTPLSLTLAAAVIGRPVPGPLAAVEAVINAWRHSPR